MVRGLQVFGAGQAAYKFGGAVDEHRQVLGADPERRALEFKVDQRRGVAVAFADQAMFRFRFHDVSLVASLMNVRGWASRTRGF